MHWSAVRPLLRCPSLGERTVWHPGAGLVLDGRGEKVFLYEAVDDPNWHKKFGIMEANLNPKPAWFALRIRARSANPSPAGSSSAPGRSRSSGARWVFEAENQLQHQQLEE